MTRKSNSIALPPFHITETTRFAVELDHELTQMLRRYRAYYKETYGAEVSESDLLREMARGFMQGDKGFRSFGQKRRRARSNASTAPSTARTTQPQRPAGQET